jgi:hypothetical protein
MELRIRIMERRFIIAQPGGIDSIQWALAIELNIHIE